MPVNLMTAYETLEAEDKKLVEQLIYSLVEKVRRRSKTSLRTEQKENLLNDLESLKGSLKNCSYSSVEEARNERLTKKFGV